MVLTGHNSLWKTNGFQSEKEGSVGEVTEPTHAVKYGRNATATDVDGRYHGETTTGRGEFADARVHGGTVFDDVFDDDSGGEWWETGARDASVEDDDGGWNGFD